MNFEVGCCMWAAPAEYCSKQAETWAKFNQLEPLRLGPVLFHQWCFFCCSCLPAVCTGHGWIHDVLPRLAAWEHFESLRSQGLALGLGFEFEPEPLRDPITWRQKSVSFCLLRKPWQGVASLAPGIGMYVCTPACQACLHVCPHGYMDACLYACTYA